MQEWEEFRKILDALPRDIKGTRQVRRFFASGACEVDIVDDSVFLPWNLMNFINIDTDIENVNVSCPVNILYNPGTDKYHRRCIVWKDA